MSRRGGVCYDWLNKGACSRGSGCNFDHPPSRRGQGRSSGNAAGGGAGRPGGGGGGGVSPGMCFEFQRSGTCRYGNSCKFTHPGAPSGRGRGGGPTRGAAGRQEKKDASLFKFVKALAYERKEKLGSELSKNEGLWRQCWQNQDRLDDSSRRMMLEIFARTPGSSSLEPPPIHSLDAVATRFLEKEAARDAPADRVLTAVKTVRDALLTALDFQWECARDEVAEGLKSIGFLAESKLRKQNKDHRDTAKELLEKLDDIDLRRDRRIKVREDVLEPGRTLDAGEPVRYDDWTNPTVEWLCTPEFFSPASCPKMKVGRAGVYESSDEYLDCSHRLWIAMTFSDGHAAFAPHCRSRGNNGACGSALWPVADSNSESAAKLRCRTRGCRRPVEFCCRIKNHDGLCGECSSGSIADHRGGPSSNASTHVYDAKVNNIGPDGVIYLSELKSRNPPPNVVHWRTTKRLSSPNLVGLVLLKSKGAKLAKTDAIQWAEVVNHHGGQRDEARRRENGEVAVNASSIVDFDPDNFDRGARVAIIDCMCFVPEWIPVLHALDSQRRSKLPFENGRHLNLVKADPVQPADALIPAAASASDCASLIQDMIDSSQLEPVREVRRDDALKQELSRKLEQLVASTTLDRMQLVSFVEALRNPVHLTQGPPGTGKSYLGVVLVRALILIRDLWIKKSRSRGACPILVLSYKNHAIDEFLVDLTKAEPRLSRNQLIRIGGQCKDNRLAVFSERANYHLDPEVQTARSSVDDLNQLRESIQFSLDHHVASFRSYYHRIFYGEDDSDRRKALVEATHILMECVVKLQTLEDVAQQRSEEKGQLSPSNAVKTFKFLFLDSQDKSNKVIQKQISSRDGSTFVPALIAGSSGSQEHWGDLLETWLSGRVPLPRCSYSKHCADLAISPEIKFCAHHLCRFCSGNDQCTRPRRDDATYYCSGHGCGLDDCGFQRLNEMQEYCKRHACYKCIELGLTAKVAEGNPPRNTCEDHPLCFFLGCLCVCDGNSLYCSEHVDLKCQATTKRKRPCKGRAISALIPYCRDHQYLANDLAIEAYPEEDEDDQAESVQPHKLPPCRALTKRGKPCKGSRIPGSEFCFDHAPPVCLHAPTDHAVSSCTNVFQQPEHADDVADLTKPVVTETSRRGDSSLRHLGSSPVHDTLDNRQACGPDGESVSSIDSFATPNGGADAPEEVAVDMEELELEEEGENIQHLRDVFELESANSDDDLASVGSDALEKVGDSDEDATTPVGLSDPQKWSWDLSLDERWESSLALMDTLRQLLIGAAVDIKASIAVARHEFQQAKSRAKARVYENKSVIGGTMVGCISRLDSIRRTKPFAVVVEEASEVLEPLLFSCLSESTLKLEMIGDHRQLQPSVMSRYEFELCNKINVSMFQRLIEAPVGHHVSSTVLSVQRRMRKNICDLTREFYADVTEIEDHEVCGSQKIGDRLSPSVRAIVATSSSCGREVPGIDPHVFLWTHDGIQGRAHVGVSRINTHEAKMVCALASYLVECGVPRPSIVCLTPYKGQLMLLRNMMFKESRPSSLKLLSKNPQDQDVVRLSTIDRFQGDEEDIVICSLVVDENSRTAFVKLVNRMVVLLSRARLGMYILGNTAYFESNGVPKHWATTFEKLQLPAENDSAGTSSSSLCNTVRTGSEIPLCCPVHRGVVASVSSVDAVRLGFCKEPCQHLLRCGHTCCLDCHWPRKQHNSNCKILLDSPCQRHPSKITCNKAYSCSKNAPSLTDYTQILSFYQCPNEVSITLQCGHAIKRPCHVERQISEGTLSMPTCEKQSPTPYAFASCGHDLDVTCRQLEEYNSNPGLVSCKRDEVYEPACGHSVSIVCHRKSRIIAGDETFVCDEKVQVTLPRCGHTRNVSCSDAQKIALWSGTSCSEVGKVEEGVVYGSQDFPCNRKVTVHRLCGHKMNLPCSEAFAKSTTLNSCRENVQGYHPSCGHRVRLRCKEASDLAAQNLAIPEGSSNFVEGQIPPRRSFPGVPLCGETVRLQRKCGHFEKMQCSEVHKPLQGCRVKVQAQSPVCGHCVDVPCHLLAELSSPFWPPDILSEICEKKMIPRDASPCRDAGTFGMVARQVVQSCSGTMKIALACGHERSFECSELLNLLSGTSSPSARCDVVVSVELECGHKIDVECDKAGDVHSLPCSSTKREKCWNHAICQNELTVPCGFEGVAACTGDSPWTCAAGRHTVNIKQCSEGLPNDCAGCYLDRLSNQIASSAPFNCESDLRKLLRAPKECVHWIAAPISDFLTSERELLTRCRSHAENVRDPKAQFLVSNSRVPCFRSLSDKNKNLECFDPKKCVNGAKSFHGIVSKHLTEHNLELLASKDSTFTLLC